MEVAVLRNPYAFAYVVSDVPAEGRARLLADLYWPVEHSFIKSFERGPGAETVANNFRRHGVESLEQLMKIRPAPWEMALAAFTERLDGTGIRWYVHGSAAMALWGIAVSPRNLDIIFPSPDDLDSIRELFLPETIYPLERCEGWILSALGGLFIHANISVAFLNAGDEPFDMGQLGCIDWRGEMIAVSPLEWLRRDNENYGRPDRVELIECHMGVV